MNDKLLLHPADQPVFRLLADVRACVAEVRINDVPVWSNRDGVASRATLAINEWLFAGDNEVIFHLEPPPGADAEPYSRAVLRDQAAVSASLLYKKNRAPWLAMQEIHAWSYLHAEDFETFHADLQARHYAIQTPAPETEDPETAAPAEDGPFLVQPGQSVSLSPEMITLEWMPSGTGLRGGFILKLPAVWPLCPWARALDLSAMHGLDYTVGRLTRSVCDSLQRRDWGMLRRLFADRRAALQAAYYLNDAAADESLAFPALLQDQAAKVGSPDPQQIKAAVCGYGRLVRAVLPEGAPAVSLISPGFGCEAEIETFWMNNGQEWRLAR